MDLRGSLWYTDHYIQWRRILLVSFNRVCCLNTSKASPEHYLQIIRHSNTVFFFSEKLYFSL